MSDNAARFVPMWQPSTADAPTVVSVSPPKVDSQTTSASTMSMGGKSKGKCTVHNVETAHATEDNGDLGVLRKKRKARARSWNSEDDFERSGAAHTLRDDQ